MRPPRSRQSPAIADPRGAAGPASPGAGLVAIAHPRLRRVEWPDPPAWRRHSLPARTNRSAPLQCHAYIARHSAGKVDDLDPQLVPALAEVFGPELVDFLGHPRQRLLPA